MDSSSNTPQAPDWHPILTATEAASIADHLDQAKQQMPFLIGLSRAQRLKLAKVGSSTGLFIKDTLATALANPGIVPRSIDLQELEARADTLKHLKEIHASLTQLLEMVDDTKTQLGSELYGVARAFYAVMKTSATVAGLNERHSRLGQRYARKARRVGAATPPAVSP